MWREGARRGGEEVVDQDDYLLVLTSSTGSHDRDEGLQQSDAFLVWEIPEDISDDVDQWHSTTSLFRRLQLLLRKEFVLLELDPSMELRREGLSTFREKHFRCVLDFEGQGWEFLR